VRKVLFYSWCIGGMTLYGFVMRWIVRAIADDYGLIPMAIFAIGFIGCCCLIARRIDIANATAAAADSMRYRPAPAPGIARIAHSRSAAG
jgi:hypothetical protein